LLRLFTSPVATGSNPVVNTTGSLLVGTNPIKHLLRAGRERNGERCAADPADCG
jgi:hypothetical protein